MRLLYRPFILSIMPTQQCTAQCGSCGTESHPGVRTRLEREDIIQAIRMAAADQFRLVVFTGGEATLRLRDIQAGIAEAKSLGLKVRLVTNGWWGKSETLALEMMSRLSDAGLDEINFSTGDEHVQFVSLRSLHRAVKAALDKNLDPLVMIEVHDGAGLTAAALKSAEAFSSLSQRDWNRIELLESPWMPLNPEDISVYPPGHLVDRFNVHSKSGCDSIFSTHTLRPDRTVSICCGLGINRLDDLHIGKLDDAPSSFKPMAAAAEDDLVKLLIREIGPERLLNEAHALDPEIEWEAKYAHKCQACIKVFSDHRVRQIVDRNAGPFYAMVAQSVALDHILENNGLL